ncbi:MAG TPA: pilus assembly protein TadG-related protein [Candidatus Acidoferrales bacterium]|nr:pilus assembly protein TadG-related protein [Candidatus Acidoferrales bacterium]
MRPKSIDYCSPDERGQAAVFVVMALGVFLLAGVAFAVDIANLWFHRQTSQNAADAACAAGAMDLLLAAQGASTGNQGFTIGTPFDCATKATAAPCVYAALNGYNGTNSIPGNQVQVSFPASDPNVASSTPPLPPTAMTNYPLIRVDVTDHVQTFFSALVSGNRSQDVRAFAVCGSLLVQGSTPVLVLDPSSSGALSLQGNSSISIYGGPSKGVQVNSSSLQGVNIGGNGALNLSQGGPNLTGSSIGVYGGPASAPGGISFGTTGSWSYPSSVVSDPFALVCAPGQTGCPKINGYSAPAVPGAPQIPSDLAAKGCKSIPCALSYHDAVHGCPRSSGCKLYTSGYYGSKISISNTAAIFDPGLYYIVGGLALNSGSTVRPGTGTGDGSGGTTFYFSGASSVTVASNSGSATLDPFYASSLSCSAGSILPGNLTPTTALQGNFLMAPCTGYYGDPLGAADTLAERGILFFQDRSASGVNATWGGGGKFMTAGAMYFHHCNAAGTGVACGSPPTYYDATFSVGGNSCAGAYAVGNLIVDRLTLSGTACVTMDLNPNSAYSTLKATMVR